MGGSPLTKKQARLLELYQDFSLWRPPAMSEMVKTVGLASNRSLIDMREVLVRKGYLEKRGKVYHPTDQTYCRPYNHFQHNQAGGTS